MSEPVNRDLVLLASEVAQALAKHRQLPDLLAFAMATFRVLLKAEGVAILLLDADKDELFFPHVAEEDPQVAERLSRTRFAAHQGIAGKVLRTGRSLRIDDVRADPWFFTGVDEKTQRPTRSVLCAPRRSSHGPIGVIEAVTPREGEGFTDDDLALLDGLAGVIAGAIENTRRGVLVADERCVERECPDPIDARVTPREHVFRRQGEYWTISYGGEISRLRHTKGLSYIAYLLRNPSRECHAIDLVDVVEGEDRATQRQAMSGSPARSLGDAGEMLDAQAKTEYKRRLKELQGELDELRALNDPGRAEKVQREIEVLTGELARAIGFGGRERRAGSHAERARVNVTRAIASALQKISEHNTGLGRHFDATIRTGTFCCYTPDPRVPFAWIL